MIDEAGTLLGVVGAVFDDATAKVGAFLDGMTVGEAGGVGASLVAWCALITLAGKVRRDLRSRRRGGLPNPRGKRWG